MKYLVNFPQTSYLRLDKEINDDLHKKVPKIFPGKWIKLHKGKTKNKRHRRMKRHTRKGGNLQTAYALYKAKREDDRKLMDLVRRRMKREKEESKELQDEALKAYIPLNKNTPLSGPAVVEPIELFNPVSRVNLKSED